MGKTRKHRRERKSHDHPTKTSDPQRAEAITVAWVISGLACALADILGSVGIYMTRAGSKPDQPSFWDTITPLMLFIAAVTGLLVICLTPLVYIVRRTRPPLPITLVSIAFAVFPFIALVVLAM